MVNGGRLFTFARGIGLLLDISSVSFGGYHTWTIGIMACGYDGTS